MIGGKRQRFDAKSNWEAAIVCYFKGIDHENSDDENKAKCYCNSSLAQYKLGLYEDD
eukprot:UN07159